MIMKAANVKKPKGKGKRTSSFSAAQYIKTHIVSTETAEGTKYAWKACARDHCLDALDQ